MNPSEIKDEASLKAWLETQTREVAVTIAHRAAMRVAPMVWANSANLFGMLGAQDLVVFRANVASAIAGLSARTNVQRACAEAAGKYEHIDCNSASDAFRAATGAAYVAVTPELDIAGDAVSAVSESLEAAVETENFVHDSLPVLRSEIWECIRADARALEFQEQSIRTVSKVKLWNDAERVLSWELSEVRKFYEAAEKGWQFWIEWYEHVLEGRPLLGDWDRHWALLTDIALIDSEIWDKGPDAVNPVVAKIAERHRTRADNAEPTPAEEVASVVASAPSSSKTEVVRRAMETNRDAIPHNLDALEAFLLLEIERLQQSNHLNAVAPDECARMIRNLVTMYEVIQSLRSRLPDTRPVNEAEAQESEALLRLFWDKLRDLPRDKADGLVEAVWQTGAGIVQGGLIFGSTSLAVAYGLPALAGVATGALLFAPDKAAVIINAARGSFPKS